MERTIRIHSALEVTDKLAEFARKVRCIPVGDGFSTGKDIRERVANEIEQYGRELSRDVLNAAKVRP